MTNIEICSFCMPINKRELAALYSLINYAAHTLNGRGESVQLMLERRFRVDHVAALAQKDFQYAIEYLLELPALCRAGGES